MNARFLNMEKQIQSLTDVVGALVKTNTGKYVEKESEKRRKKTRIYVELQSLPESSKRHEVREISDDETSSTVHDDVTIILDQ